MEQRLFLDRVHMLSRQMAEHQRVERTSCVFPDTANTSSTVRNRAPEAAESALNPPVTETFIEHGFVMIFDSHEAEYIRETRRGNLRHVPDLFKHGVRMQKES